MRRIAITLLLVATAACSGSGSKQVSTSPSPTPSTAAVTGAFAPASGRASTVVAKVAVGGQPCGVVVAAGFAWVTDAKSATLKRIDLETNTVSGSFPVDKTPCELMAARGSLWVVTQSGVLDRVDPSSGKVIARVQVGAMSYEAVDAFGSIWVTNRNTRTLTQVDPANNRVIGTALISGIYPGGIVGAGGALWIGNDTGGADFVVRFDPKTKVPREIKAGSRPAFVAVSAGSVWVSNEDDGTVSRISVATEQVVSTIPAGERPVNLSAGPGKAGEVWVPDDRGDLLTRIDPATGTAIERLAVGRGPAVVAVTATEVWVTHFEDGSVWRIAIGAR